MDKKRDRLPIFYSLTDKKQLSSNTIFRRVLLTVVSVEQMQHNGKTRAVVRGTGLAFSLRHEILAPHFLGRNCG